MKGEYANETHFVTQNSAAKYVRVVTSDSWSHVPLTSFMLFSDGVEDLFVSHKTREVVQGANQMMEWLQKYPEEEANEYLLGNLEDVFKHKSWDDCTIGLMTLLAEDDEVDEINEVDQDAIATSNANRDETSNSVYPPTPTFCDSNVEAIREDALVPSYVKSLGGKKLVTKQSLIRRLFPSLGRLVTRRKN